MKQYIPDYYIQAPCYFCGYNGADYWQTGTHKKCCPYYNIASSEERERILITKMIPDALTAKYAYTTEQEQEERSCENCGYNEAPNDEKPCWTCEETFTEWKPKQNQPKQEISTEDLPAEITEMVNANIWDIAGVEQKPSAEWGPVIPGHDSKSNNYEYAINNNAEGIQIAHKDNHMQWIRINSDYDHLFNEVTSLHTQLSALKKQINDIGLQTLSNGNVISHFMVKLNDVEKRFDQHGNDDSRHVNLIGE